MQHCGHGERNALPATISQRRNLIWPAHWTSGFRIRGWGPGAPPAPFLSARRASLAVGVDRDRAMQASQHTRCGASVPAKLTRAAASSPLVRCASQQPRQAGNQRTGASQASVGRAGKRAALVAAAVSAGSLFQPQTLLQTALGGGGNGGLGGNGGGWGGDHGWSRYFGVQPALALKEEEEDEGLFDDDDKSGRGPVADKPAATSAEDEQTFICESVKAVNLPTGPGIPTQARPETAAPKCCSTFARVMPCCWRREENNPLDDHLSPTLNRKNPTRRESSSTA